MLLYRLRYSFHNWAAQQDYGYLNVREPWIWPAADQKNYEWTLHKYGTFFTELGLAQSWQRTLEKYNPEIVVYQAEQVLTEEEEWHVLSKKAGEMWRLMEIRRGREADRQTFNSHKDFPS